MKNQRLNLSSFHFVATNSCGGGTCPAILINENGDALVQGLVVEESVKKDLNVPKGEDVVFVPESVIQDFLRKN